MKKPKRIYELVFVAKFGVTDEHYDFEMLILSSESKFIFWVKVIIAFPFIVAIHERDYPNYLLKDYKIRKHLI